MTKTPATTNPIIGALAASLLAVAATACQTEASAGPPKRVRVQITTAERRAVADEQRYAGAVEPLRRVDVAFRVSGYVDELGGTDGRPFEEGDRVKAGTVLARIRSSDYQERVTNANAAIAEANARRTLAERELATSRHLYETDATTTSDLDSRQAQLDAAKAQVAGANARAREAGVNLRDTTLRAPMDGVILRRSIEVGTFVKGGEAAFVIADDSGHKIVFAVPDREASMLSPGKTIEVRAHGDRAATQATITVVDPSAENASRNFRVEALVGSGSGSGAGTGAGAGAGLRPGMPVSVTIGGFGTGEKPIILPLSTLSRSPNDPDRFAVWVATDEQGDTIAVAHDVECGEMIGDQVTIVRGLSGGERVVTAGAHLLYQDARIDILPQARW